MGTTSLHREKGISTADFFAREFGAAYAAAVVATATTSGVFYAVVEVDAAENTRLVPDENGKVRYCWVVTTSTSSGYYNFSYKEITEFYGPLVATCPDRLLALLSPIKDDGRDDSPSAWARQWRERCGARAQRMDALKTIGTTVKLPQALRFSDGVTEDTFILCERKGTTLRFLRQSDRRLVRLSAAQIEDLTVVETSVEMKAAA